MGACLFSLKSLVTIDPGSMILCSSGRSCFAKVYWWSVSTMTTNRRKQHQHTVSLLTSPIFFPANLFIHSWFLSSPPAALLVIGSTRGMFRYCFDEKRLMFGIGNFAWRFLLVYDWKSLMRSWTKKQKTEGLYVRRTLVTHSPNTSSLQLTCWIQTSTS